MTKSSSTLFSTFRSNLPSMAGKTAVITGTTSGTGKAAAMTLAKLGAKVLVLNRASHRSTTSSSELTVAFPNAQIHSVECDLQAFDSVETASAQVAELCPEGVHVLCNNAGVMALPDTATADGFDVQMQTNHLSHFLLTRNLMPLLDRASNATGETRVVNHSSVARLSPSKTLHPEYLERRGGELGGNGSAFQNAMFRGARWLRYNQSKLANCAFTAALHHQLQKQGSNIKALVAHPGLSNTQLQKTSVKEGGMGSVVTNLMMRFSQTPEEGAMGILSAMCLTNAKSGQFYGPGSGASALKGPARPFDLEAFYDNAETRDLLWQKSVHAIGKDFSI